MAVETKIDVTASSVELRRARGLQRFWRAYLRLGLIVLALESLGVLSYLLLSPHGPHRAVLQVISSVSFVVAAGLLPATARLASNVAWRYQFSLSATVLSGVLLTVCIWLDSGIDSPLLFLLALPIVNAAVGLPVRAVVLCAATAAVEFGVVASADPFVSHSSGDIVLVTSFLVGMTLLALGWAVSRAKLREEDAGLFAEVVRLAQTDTLTGCLNHGSFFERFSGEIDRALRHGGPLSLLVADVDLFKAFNDANGHTAGDEALAVVGSFIRQTSRSFDVVGRVGGDEFAVLLPETTLSNAREIAERMALGLKHPNGLAISVSVGFATLNHLEPTAKRLFRDADTGLYRAKTSGRACVASNIDARATTLGEGGRRRTQAQEEADTRRLEDDVRGARRATEEAIGILDTLDSSTSLGLGFIGTDMRILRINPVLAAVNGGSVETQIGRSVEEVVPGLWPVLEEAYRAVLETGEPVINKEISGELAGDPGQVHFWWTSFYPVSAHGKMMGVLVVAIDITDRKHLEESQVALTKAVVGALAAAVEMRDPYTAGHQQRVAQIAVAIAVRIRLAAEEIDMIGLASRIHDIGKLAIPAEILARPGRLTKAEMELVREHAKAGADMLESVGFSGPVRTMILEHHERLDGSGYPSGLHRDEISLGGRILAVADVAEAMSSHRPYRPRMSLDVVMKELMANSGTLYEPAVVDACIQVLGETHLEFKDK